MKPAPEKLVILVPSIICIGVHQLIIWIKTHWNGLVITQIIVLLVTVQKLMFQKVTYVQTTIIKLA